MIKKICAGLLALSMILALSACKGSANNATPTDASASDGETVVVLED